MSWRGILRKAGISVSGGLHTFTQRGIVVTRSNPSAGINGISLAVNPGATFTGSVAGVRSTVTVSANVAMGNLYGGRFELLLTLNPSTSGHTAGLYVQATTRVSGSNPTSVLSLVKSGALGGTTTPFIFIQDSSTQKSTILMDVGGVIGGGAVGTGSGALYHNNTLKIKVNSDTRYIPLSTVEGNYSPVLTGPTAAVNGIYSLITANAAWTSGSLAAIRAKINVSIAGAGGNVYGGWFGINFTAATTGLGLTTGLYAQAGSDVAAVKVSSVLHACLTGGASAVMTRVPLLCLQDNVTGTQTDTLMEVGFHAGGSTVKTGSGGMYYNETLKIYVNNNARFIPLSTVEGTYTMTLTGPTVAVNGIYQLITASSNWSGSIASIRSRITSTATGAIGNARAIMALIDMAAAPASQGHTAAGYFEGATTDAATNITGIISLVKSGAAGGGSTPFINFLDASTTKSTVLFELGTGNLMGTASSGNPGIALYETSCVITAIGEFTAALAIKINGTRMYIPLIAANLIRD